MTVVEGAFATGGGFAARFDCLGSVTEARVGGVAVTVGLPRLNVEGERPTLTAPVFEKPAAVEGWVEPSGDAPDTWGSVFEWDTNAGPAIDGAAWVRRVRLAVSAAAVDEAAAAGVATRLYREVDGWWDRVAEWAEVVTGQQLRGDGQRSVYRVGGGLSLWAGSADDVRMLGSVEPILLMGSRRDVALDKAAWTAILAKVDSGVRPPLPWRVARSAQFALRAGDARRAVIDAGTAAELALTALLDKRLSGVEKNVAEQLLSKSKMLGMKSALHKALGGPLRDDFRQVLIEPRNEAAHAGATFTREVAAAALGAAVELVELANPRSQLLRVTGGRGHRPRSKTAGASSAPAVRWITRSASRR